MTTPSPETVGCCDECIGYTPYGTTIHCMRKDCPCHKPDTVEKCEHKWRDEVSGIRECEKCSRHELVSNTSSDTVEKPCSPYCGLSPHCDNGHQKPQCEHECACGEPSPASIVDHGKDKCYLQGTRPKPQPTAIERLEIQAHGKPGSLEDGFAKIIAKVNEIIDWINSQSNRTT